MEQHEERLVDETEGRLVRTVVIAILISGILLTVAVAFMVHLVAPDWGWSGAWAAGAFAGFWTSVYAGGTAGSGWFQAKEDQAHGHRPVAVAVPDTPHLADAA
jgi:hypothetical protein